MASQKRNNQKTTTARKKVEQKTGQRTTRKAEPKVSAAERKKAARQESIRRELTACALVLLAIFSLHGCFQKNAVPLRFLCNLEKGLVGAGFYILPVLYIWTALILLRSGKRLMRLRAWSTMILSVIVGAFAQVIRPGGAVWSISIVKVLYRAGVDGHGGGILSGLLGNLLESCFSAVGAVLLLILLLQALGILKF